MYRKYYNEYERRAEEIRRAAEAIESGKRPPPVKNISEAPQSPVLPVNLPSPKGTAQKKSPAPFINGIFDGLFGKFGTDDIILLVLIFILIQEKDNDKILLLILGYLFLSGL